MLLEVINTMQQGNPPPHWQPNQAQFQNQQYPLTSTPGQFQYPPPPPYNVPLMVEANSRYIHINNKLHRGESL